jgi:hypothetical protein
VVVVRARSGLCRSSSNPSAALFWFLVTLDTYRQRTAVWCSVHLNFQKIFFHQQPLSVFSFNHGSLSVWVNLIMVMRSLQSCDCTRESVADSIAPHAQYVTLQHDYSHWISYLLFRILPIKHWNCLMWETIDSYSHWISYLFFEIPPIKHWNCKR